MRLKLLALATLSVFASAAPARETALHLAPAARGDQAVAALRAPAAPLATADLDRTPVAMAWKLDPKEKLDAAPAPFVRESREYWSDVGEAQLRAGVKLATTSPEALIRLSPHGGNDAALDPSGVLLRYAGQQHTAAEAARQVADATALRAAGMDVPSGTVVMKLKREAGASGIELAAPNARGRYLVHVYEPQSDFVLRLQAEHDNLVAGESQRLVVSLDGASRQRRLDLVEGVLSAPDGHTQALRFTRQSDGRYVASVTPDAAHAGGPGLWEAHAFASGTQRGQGVLRDAKTAFAVAQPTARFDGALQREDGAALALRIGVEVAAASRYQVSGVVYGSAADGSLQPLAMAQSAAWLEPGQASVRLQVDDASLRASGLAAPFELRDLRLTNQADLSLIERRALGARLER